MWDVVAFFAAQAGHDPCGRPSLLHDDDAAVVQHSLADLGLLVRGASTTTNT